MRFRNRSVPCVGLVLLAVACGLAACGSDDAALKPRPGAAAGEGDSAGAPGAAGSESTVGGQGETGAGGAAGASPEAGSGGGSGGGGEGGAEGEEQLPTFEPYSSDVVIADYYGDQGLFRLTLSDTGVSEPQALLTVQPGQRALWQQLDGDAIITTLKDDTHGHLYRQPLAGGDAVRITHDLAEHEAVEKWAALGDTIYYAVATFVGNSQSHAGALWKAEPKAGSYERTQLALSEPSDQHAIYELWAIGSSLYLPGSVSMLGGGGHVFDRVAPPSDQVKPVALLDYEFHLHYYGSGALTYRGKSATGGYGIYAADLNQDEPKGQRLSPDNEPLGNNPQLHGASRHYFFSTKPAGAGEHGYFADLSNEPFKVVPLLTSEDPAAMQFGSWSARGRYFYLHEGTPGVDVTTYVVDTAKETPTARKTSRRLGEGWLSYSPDDRFYAFLRPELWLMKPNDEAFALRIDQGLELAGSTVQNAAFSSDGYHVWFVLSDGRCFIDDTLARTPPDPSEVTPSDLPEGWRIDHAAQAPNGAFLLAASTDDAQAREAHADQALYYLPRLPSGQYGAAERVDVAGIRFLEPIE